MEDQTDSAALSHLGRERVRLVSSKLLDDEMAGISTDVGRSALAELGPRLLGRHSECESLDRLVAKVRAGQSQVLVLRGEAGVGKTMLMEYVVGSSSGCRVARATGVEFEQELAFAGLLQLCAPMVGLLDRIPGPQRDALATAFGLCRGRPPDRFLVGLAVLSLLTEVAEEQPLICVVDDVQRLDLVSVQTLAFVARRLSSERVALVLATHAEDDEQGLHGLPELPISGLGDANAHALLGETLLWPMDAAVRDRIVAETRGNPRALLEPFGCLTRAELEFGLGRTDTMPRSSRIEEDYVRRLQPLPAGTRRLLLAAAIEPVGDVTLLWRALERLGIGAEAAAPAAGLIEFGARVRFRHPLARSATCRAAGVRDLQEVHRALAEVTDPELDPDRRAWHRAHAATGRDENVAAALELSADRAQARAGLAAGAAFHVRAAELTPDPARRAQRAFAAAQAKHLAGGTDAALGLLATAEAGPLDERQRARADFLRAQIAFASRRSRRSSDAPALLLSAAKQLEPLDPTTARDAYLEAFSAALVAGRPSRTVAEVARAARAAPVPTTPDATDLLLAGLSLLVTEGYAAGVPMLRHALRTFHTEDISVEEKLRWLCHSEPVAMALWDDESWHVLADRHVKLAREVGAISHLPHALNSSVFAHLFAGELAAAASQVEEAHAVGEAIGTSMAPCGALGLAAWQGNEVTVDELTEGIMCEVVPRGEGMGVTITQWARAVISNSLGRYQDALAAAQQASEYTHELEFSTLSLVELIEAAARSGQDERASVALTRLAETTQSSGTDWALGIEARSRALVSEGDVAERNYREAVDRLGRTRIRMELARAHLLYGEWLRRESRRVDAREALRTAHELFTSMGAKAFAERTRRELSATGTTVRKRCAETRDDLTAQEAQVAQLARDGSTNLEIGLKLFISPRTVEWHLHNVFTKLGISSRKQLRGPRLKAGPDAVSA